MKVSELFETRVEEKIDPVIKVGDVADERKLAGEIGSYVVTPLIEKYLDDFLEHYTDTFLTDTTEIGAWISGYFGSGKSHLAKIMALLTENRMLEGATACKRFDARIPPDAPHRGSIQRSLQRMNQVETKVLAFNIPTVADSRSRPLPQLLLSQYYFTRGYVGNLLYARVIEAELDKRGKLKELHDALAKRAKKGIDQIRNNPAFYRKALYEAACEVAPEVFEKPEQVQRSLEDAERGELYNVSFLIDTILSDLKKTEQEKKKPQRLIFVLDESGQWIGDDAGRLSQLQALIEEAAVKAKGKIWIFVTTHGDMGSIYKEARALEGDMKKIEGRFRFRFALTTENIEQVLEDRLLKKNLAGKEELSKLYGPKAGVLRGVGELANVSQTLPVCDAKNFITYYPFLPYQVNLVPEIVKTLRSKGGRGEQLSGSTRTLLAITQDILRVGRRKYLDAGVGELVSFDELYANLSGEGEVSPDIRTELARIKDRVPNATPLTSRVAEVLYLIHEIPYIPRTKDNIARLLIESVDDDLPAILVRVEPELERLKAAKVVSQIGEEYEFLTGVRRTFEEEVEAAEADFGHQQDRERGLAREFVQDAGKAHWREWLGSDVVSYQGHEFSFKLRVDDNPVSSTRGDITLSFISPLGAHNQTVLHDIENQSLHEQFTIFFVCGRIMRFDQDLSRFLAMQHVIENWKRDPQKSDDAKKLTQERDANDLPKLKRKVLEGFKEGIKSGYVVFKGSSRTIAGKPGQTPSDALRAEMATFWPNLYPKFDRLPVRVSDDQRAIQNVLAGASDPGPDVRALKIYESSGKIDPNCPLLDEVRIHLATQQNAGRRVVGKDLLGVFAGPPYGWDPNAIRVGIAAMVRCGAVKVLINKKPFMNPADKDLVDAIRVSRNFDKVEILLEESEVKPDVFTAVRSFLMKLAKKRGIDETPAALSDAAGGLAAGILGKADTVNLWSSASGLPLPKSFTEGEEAWRKVAALSNPVHRVNEIHSSAALLQSGYEMIETYTEFHTKNGALFTGMSRLVGDLQAISHLVDEDNIINMFINAFGTARDSASFADSETWKQLHGLKAQAELELASLGAQWKAQARQQAEQALQRLPGDLAQRELDPALAAPLGKPLTEFLNGLDAVTLPAKMANLPQRAAQLVNQLGQAIAEEVRKKQKKETKPPRNVRRLRINEVDTVTRVTSEPEWDALRTKLDAHVKRLLSEGNDVELV